MQHEIKGVLPQQLNQKRKAEVLLARFNAPDKLKKHVRPTLGPDGYPDGGVESAFCGKGDVCSRCGITRADALETKEGGTCDVAAFRKFSMPLDFVGMTVQEDAQRDPLADVFA